MTTISPGSGQWGLWSRGISVTHPHLDLEPQWLCMHAKTNKLLKMEVIVLKEDTDSLALGLMFPIVLQDGHSSQADVFGGGIMPPCFISGCH